MAEAQYIDIGNGRCDIQNDQEDLPAGHSIQDVIEQNFRIGEILFFQRTFDFDCIGLPTSFHMGVAITLSQATTVSSDAIVNRTDEGAGTVNVRLEIKIVRHGHCEAILRNGYNELGSFEEEADNSQASISEETAIAFHEEGNLRFEFVLTVEGCHGEKDETETTSSEDSSEETNSSVEFS